MTVACLECVSVGVGVCVRVCVCLYVFVCTHVWHCSDLDFIRVAHVFQYSIAYHIEYNSSLS